MTVQGGWDVATGKRVCTPDRAGNVVIKADANSTVTTVVIALAVGSSTLEQKKKYENVPVLRNLVPSQVLLGNSSFNVGDSISAGLPSYVRNRIKAIAGILDRG